MLSQKHRRVCVSSHETLGLAEERYCASEGSAILSQKCCKAKEVIIFSKLITSLKNNKNLLHLLSDLHPFSHSLESPRRGLCLRKGENVYKMVANELFNMKKKGHTSPFLYLISCLQQDKSILLLLHPATMEVAVYNFFFRPSVR